MSNGGFMSYRLACELNDRIAAIASVTGGMFSGYLPQCEPGRPVPILEIHGTADDVVPYNGTPNVNVPVETTVNFWADNNGCGNMPDGIPLPNTAPNDGSTAERFDYPGCAAGSAVSLIKITGGGHTWPGSGIIIGSTNQDFNASATIWQFFQQFQLDLTSPTRDLPLSRQELLVYPNPASSQLRIVSSDRPWTEYTIYNAAGRAAVSGKLHRQPIDVSRLPSGIYYLLVSNQREWNRVRFVKE